MPPLLCSAPFTLYSAYLVVSFGGRLDYVFAYSLSYPTGTHSYSVSIDHVRYPGVGSVIAPKRTRLLERETWLDKLVQL